MICDRVSQDIWDNKKASRLFIFKNRCVLQFFGLENNIFSYGVIYGSSLAFADYVYYRAC